MEITIDDLPEERRYVATNESGQQVGFVEYIRTDEMITIAHTEVDPAFEGQGVGGKLAREVLDQARADGVTVLPLCPFIKGWIARHKEYEDVVA